MLKAPHTDLIFGGLNCKTGSEVVSELNGGLDKAAYISRYAIKLQCLLGIDAELATQSAEASFEDWDGVYTPEEAADDEAGYWAADI